MGASFRRGFRLGPYLVRPALGRITGPDGTVRVEPRAMDVLVELAARAPEPVAREALIAAVWAHPFVTDGVVSRCVCLLRQALHDDPEQPRFIETLSKLGYRLLVRAAPDHEAPFDDARVCGDPDAQSRPTWIAVLPFLNFCARAVDERANDALTVLVIAELSVDPTLRVISPTSAMAYKDARKSVREIAAELGVAHVVEGSLLEDGGRLHVVVQLIDATTDAHRWTGFFAREPLEIPLRELARSIADDLGARIARDPPRPAGATGERQTRARAGDNPVYRL